ncbi:MAG: hypothetical protein A3E01_02630 [Gammaproteobacteria bacterium RIFCSPHIGHO2_12_FULL_63_22]|nr:MAG: hypothetical protein A3E01_02630 [Gammaproteobacteria bacterium RIFCSPHIGHO2_12_FULL_63_22]
MSDDLPPLLDDDIDEWLLILKESSYGQINHHLLTRDCVRVFAELRCLRVELAAALEVLQSIVASDGVVSFPLFEEIEGVLKRHGR